MCGGTYRIVLLSVVGVYYTPRRSAQEGDQDSTQYYDILEKDIE